MPLQRLSFDDFSDKTEMIICLRDHHNQLVDYCNELERRLAEVEKKTGNQCDCSSGLCPIHPTTQQKTSVAEERKKIVDMMWQVREDWRNDGQMQALPTADYLISLITKDK